jgi:hypothetical protein
MSTEPKHPQPSRQPSQTQTQTPTPRQSEPRLYLRLGAGRPRLYERGGPRIRPPITLPTKPFNWRDE